MRRVGRGLCECSQSWRPRHQLGQPQLDARRRKGAGEGQGGRTPQGSGDPYQQKPRLLTGGGGLERKVHEVASSALWCPGQRAAGTSPAQTPARPTQTPARGPQPRGAGAPSPRALDRSGRTGLWREGGAADGETPLPPQPPRSPSSPSLPLKRGRQRGRKRVFINSSSPS